MSIEDESDGYQAYLLRLWRARCKGRWQWRASIEIPGTGERLLFANLEQLSSYLKGQCEQKVPDPTTLPGARQGRDKLAPWD
jgi:hypothetical protein